MKMDGYQNKRVAGGGFCKQLKKNGMDGGKWSRLEKGQSMKMKGVVYTPIAMERVRKR
jgi:hypothetical protein